MHACAGPDTQLALLLDRDINKEKSISLHKNRREGLDISAYAYIIIILFVRPSVRACVRACVRAGGHGKPFDLF